VGLEVGAVGAIVGVAVGAAVGVEVGVSVGAAVGDAVGVGVSHEPSERQMELSQSLLIRHCWEARHGGQLVPPQSISVSSPPFIPSLQSGWLGIDVGAAVGELVG
jgi:hypothetical protein